MNGFARVGDSEATFTSSTSRSIPDTSASSPSPPSTPTTPTTPISKIHPTFKPSPPYPYPIRKRRTNDPRDAPGLAFSRVLFDLPEGDLASSVQFGADGRKDSKETTEATETTESKEIIETRSSTSIPPPPTSHSVKMETEAGTTFVGSTSSSKHSRPSTPARSPSPTPSSTPTAIPSQSSTTSGSAPAPASTSTPPVAKKSWASLLRSSSPSSPSSASASPSSPSSSTSPSTGGRQRLRTSSLVGTSVPGSSSTSTSNSELDKKRRELSALLRTTGPMALGMEGISKMHPRGLINTGNMCFANSVLQMLIYTPEFAVLVGALGRIGRSAGDVGGGGGGIGQIAGIETPLVDATVEFLGLHQEQQASLSSSSSTPSSTSSSTANSSSSSTHDPFCPFIPSPIYTALKSKPQFDHMPMNGAQQEDAEEFLGFFLDGLEEELGKLRVALDVGKGKGKEREVLERQRYEEGAEEIQQQADSEDGWVQVGKNNHTTTIVSHTSSSSPHSPSTPPSPLTHIFTGHFRSTIRIRGHKEDRATLEEWRSLRLDIQSPSIHSIQDALSALAQPQTLYLTTPQKQEVEASQQVLIESLPPVLVVQLKRFHGAGIGSVIKITKQITFGPELVVGTDVLRAWGNARGVRYKLFGVIYHHGLSAEGGHYTIDVLHPLPSLSSSPSSLSSSTSSWIHIDDDLVTPISPADVFSLSPSAGYTMTNGRCPYLLFYHRM
ncbi:hypothetical protein F5880DRAFT_1492205 [Lentinula raphanica]|nr:hypothetical protein F5880DRAFT_1492205 [Lentinula raphanica]